MLISLALAAALAAPGPADTLPTFADSATRSLVLRAMARHASQDTLVSDYQSRFRYRISFGLGRRNWDRIPTAAVEEQEGQVRWQRPNDLQVEVQGRRSQSRNSSLNLNSMFDQPWFVPRSVSDSVRAFGEDFPEHAALHPLAADGPDWYRYEITDSARVTNPDGREVRLAGVKVTPARPGAILVVGTLWFDEGSAEVVRFSFRFVGQNLWVSPDGDTKSDTSDARFANRIISRILTLDADLEYALEDGKYWMPYRQVLSGRVRVPFMGGLVIPFQSETRFEDYTINTGRRIVFTVPLPDTSVGPDSAMALVRSRRDSIRAERRRRSQGGGDEADTTEAREFAGTWSNGRYEILRAPADSLRRYHGWGDSLVLDQSAAEEAQIRSVQSDLERMAAGLPTGISGIPRGGIDYERLGTLFLFNRVQGLSIGGGYQWQPAGWAFATIEPRLRYGFSDGIPVASLGLSRDAPGGKFTLRAYHEMEEPDPFSRGLTFANTFNALFGASDDADYYLGTGGQVAFVRSVARGIDWTIQGGGEDQESVATQTTSAINDFLGGSGVLPANPPVADGFFGTFLTRLEGQTGRSRWLVAGSGITGSPGTGGRIYGAWQQPIGGRTGVTFRLKAGIATDSALPQLQFRAGGPETVRGFTYGTQTGQALWSLQADFAPTGGWFRPVFFADVGQSTAPRRLFNSTVLVGGGVGASFVRGLVRFDLSHPLYGAGGFKFELALRAVR
jgi:hypothetical protein